MRFLPRHQGKMYISEEKLTLPTSGKSKSMILEGLAKYSLYGISQESGGKYRRA